MLTFDRLGDWVYIFGTGGLARNKPIWLWRCAADTFPHGLWEPWGLDQVGWAWGNPNERTPVLPGRYGELSFRFIQGNAVLSFFDVDRYTCSALHQDQAHRPLARRQQGRLRARPPASAALRRLHLPRTRGSTSPTA